MAYETLRTDLEQGVLTVRLHRPERLNAFSPKMLRELLALLDEIDADDRIRVAIRITSYNVCYTKLLRDRRSDADEVGFVVSGEGRVRVARSDLV